MVRRKPIGIRGRLGVNTPSLLSGNMILSTDILDKLNAIKDEASKSAYNSYNADYYNSLVKTDNREIPIVIGNIGDYQTPALSGDTKTSKKSKYNGSGSQFTNDIYQSYYRAVRPGASSDEDAARQAKFLTQKAAFETGYGRSIANTHNYGGHRTKAGWLAFNSMDDFTRRDVALLDKKWSNWRTAKNENDFVNAITTNRGKGVYAPRQEYQGYFGLTNRTNSYLNMEKRRLRCGGEISRPKAFLGAVIGAFGNVASTLIQSNAQEEMAKRQQEAEDRRYYSNLAMNMSNVLNNRDAQEAYEKQFRVAYKRGGRRKLRDGVKITDGGYGIPMGNDTFLLRGGSHEDINETGQTGIGLNIDGKEIEAEGGEVVQKTPNEVRVFSDSMVLPNGMTPAQAVEAGGNKTDIFNIQQSMNGDYGIKNKRRLRNGGCLSRPVGRIHADIGIGVKRDKDGRPYKEVKRRNPDGSVSFVVQYVDGQKDHRSDGYGGRSSYTQNTDNNTDGGGVRGGSSFDSFVRNAVGYLPYGRQIYNFLSNRNRSKGGDMTSTSEVKPSSNTYATKGGVPNSNTGGGIRGGNGTSGGGIRGNSSQSVEEPTAQSAYAQQYARNNTRSLVSSDTGSSSQPSRGAVVSSDTGRRRLASRGAVPTTEMPKTRTLASPIGPEPYYPEDDILKEAYGDSILWEGAETGNTDDDVDTFVPVTDTESGTNRWGLVTKGSDWIGLGADLLGSISTGLLSANAARNMVMPREPIPMQAVKLPTTYSIGSDLAENNRLTKEMLRDSRNNISSSMALNTMRNRIRLASNDRINSLYQTKSRAENEMLTRDALNQQDVAKTNAALYNDYLTRLTEAQNRQALMKASAYSGMLTGLSDAVGNFLDQGKQRYSDQQAMRYYTALLPEEGRQWLRRNRIDFLRRGGKIG